MIGGCTVDVDVRPGPPATMAVCVTGEFDAAQVPEFDRRTADVPSHVTAVVVDVSEATIIDSSGLGALLRLRTRCVEAGVEYGTLVAQPFQWTLMRITGLTDILAVRRSPNSH